MKSSAIGGLAVFTAVAVAMIGIVPHANAATIRAVRTLASSSAPVVAALVSAR